jgi:hypothetical protein
MKNQRHLLNLMVSNTGRTTTKPPALGESVQDLVTYWPSWAKDVRRVK